MAVLFSSGSGFSANCKEFSSEVGIADDVSEGVRVITILEVCRGIVVTVCKTVTVDCIFMTGTSTRLVTIFVCVTCTVANEGVADACSSFSRTKFCWITFATNMPAAAEPVIATMKQKMVVTIRMGCWRRSLRMREIFVGRRGRYFGYVSSSIPSRSSGSIGIDRDLDILDMFDVESVVVLAGDSFGVGAAMVQKQGERSIEDVTVKGE
jgi:hypothetical protein